MRTRYSETTALNDDSAKIENMTVPGDDMNRGGIPDIIQQNMTVHGFALESESDLEESDEQSSDEDGPFGTGRVAGPTAGLWPETDGLGAGSCRSGNL